ncbi:hypothetical protein FDECE_7870 [Fusarium decemcellulare]|nr:hypothetical protein FDECE_7870 [Fusarium decemcellulare]
MRLSQVFLSGLFASITSAGCFDVGIEWSDFKDFAKGEIQRLCEDRTLSGDFIRNQYKIACFNIGENKVDLRVQVDGLGPLPDGQTAHVAVSDCVDYLSREVNGCARGGSSIYDFPETGNIRFVADPNQGNCA